MLIKGRREENTLTNSEYLPNDMIQLHQQRISANMLMTSVIDLWDKVTCTSRHSPSLSAIYLSLASSHYS